MVGEVREPGGQDFDVAQDAKVSVETPAVVKESVCPS
jgi:hypothetical protein